MTSKINVSIILYSLLFSISISVETDGTRLVRQRFQEGRHCMDQTDYPQIITDIYAMKLYVQKLCSQVNPSTASSYISTNYGSKVKVMGKGSFGQVLKYKKDAKFYAIKIPNSFDYKDMFKELNASECIKEMLHDSPELNNMAYIFECVQPLRKSPHLIMKFLPMDLKAYIKLKYSNGWANLNDTQRTRMVTQMYKMAKTLAALHSKQIAHRDLKPQNIMMTSKGNPVLIDFGLLTPMGDFARTLAGTPYFIDYEVVNRNSQGMASDVYSLLMTYVEMIHGLRGETVLNSVLNSGGYSQVMNGTKSKYEPNFARTSLPSEFAWMQHMFVPSRSGRWKMPQVVAQFEKMLGISSGPSDDPSDQKAIAQQKVAEKNVVDVRPKQEIQNIVVERPAQRQEKMQIPDEQILAISKNVARPVVVSEESKFIGQKKEQFGFDDRQFKNKYLDFNPSKQVIQEKVEVTPTNLANNYYRYEKKIDNSRHVPAFDKHRMEQFNQKMSALDQMIAQMQAERVERAKVLNRKIGKGQVQKRKMKFIL